MQVIPSVPDRTDEYRAYVQRLHQESLDKKRLKREGRWTAPLSRDARGDELSGHWATPPEVLQESLEILDALGLPTRYTLDIAAAPTTTVAPNWYGPFHGDPERRDALADGVSWVAPDGGGAWLNSPYNKIKAFAARAAATTGPLMFLSFLRADTEWWRIAIAGSYAFWAREGRVSFIDPVTEQKGQTAPAPSALILFGVPAEVALAPRAARVGRWQRYVVSK